MSRYILEHKGNGDYDCGNMPDVDFKKFIIALAEVKKSKKFPYSMEQPQKIIFIPDKIINFVTE